MWSCRGNPSLIPPALPPPRPLLITKPNRIFLVSAKFQPRRSRRQNTNFNYNLYDDDSDDNNVVQLTPETEDSVDDVYFRTQDSGDQQQQVPSGSDILMALRRATVRKHNTKKKQKLKQQTGPDEKGKQEVVSNAPVRPLRIRSDWSARLDELEQRLQDLLHI